MPMASTRGQGGKNMFLAGLAAAMVVSSLPACESLVLGHPRLATRSMPRSGSFCWNRRVRPATATGVLMLQGGAGAGGGGGGRVAMLAATSRTLLANFWDEALILAEDKVIEFLEVGGIIGFLMEEMVLLVGSKFIEILAFLGCIGAGIAAALFLRLAITAAVYMLRTFGSLSLFGSADRAKWRLVRGQGFFLVANPGLGIQAEFPYKGAGMLVKAGSGGIQRVWADGETYERFAFKTGQELASRIKTAKSVKSQVKRLRGKLGRWELSRDKEEGRTGSIAITNSFTKEIVTLSAEGMVHSGGSKVISVGRNGQWDEELADGERRGLLGQGGAEDAADNDFSAGEESEEEDIDDLICPLSNQPMGDPWVAEDGHSYEKSKIDEWLRENDTSPVTGEVLRSKKLIPNNSLRAIIKGIQKPKAGSP